MSSYEPSIELLGDKALMVRLGDEVSRDCFDRIALLQRSLRADPIEGIIEWAPAYTTLGIYYDPLLISSDELMRRLMGQLRHVAGLDSTSKIAERVSRLLEIPVLYGGEFGSDLDEVARYNEVTSEEVISLHTQPEYFVHMIGFLPGFPYLSGLPSRIATPRRDTPRTQVPAGSVGIGGLQTGIYPMDSPGGWQIIGRTPTVLFDPNLDPPAMIRAGDSIKFRSIDRNEFEYLRQLSQDSR